MRHMVSSVTLQRTRDHAWMMWIDGLSSRPEPPELLQFHLLVARRMGLATQYAEALAALGTTAGNFGEMIWHPRTFVECTNAPQDWQVVERDAAAHLRIVAEILVRAIANLDLMWSRLERRCLGTPDFDEVIRTEAMLQYVMRQPNPVQPGLQSGIFSHPRPYVRVRDSADLFPQLDGDWSIGHDIPAFHEPPPDDARDMTTQSALCEWEQSSEALPAYQCHREAVMAWHKAAASYEWSLAEMRERPRDPFRLTEDARLFIHASRDLDRSGYEWESTSTHLPEYRRYRITEGDATHIPFWPEP